MSDDDDFDTPRSSSRDGVNFFAELESLSDEDRFEPFAITLISGERLVVEHRVQFLVLKMMYIYFPSGGGLIKFPFNSVCSFLVYPEKLNQ